MQIELNYSELLTICNALTVAESRDNTAQLRDRLYQQLMAQKELDEMEFDDCVGGACRL